ncbi:MAG TPA: tRNA (adenosine(37)-N6)-threonylcarbamoyltransferase complex dimerization subunit type 1 TsaB, partial [Pirellulaceae bacterium]|nr:tRNA (adenosine(37)-N6)-threonylcarbamoyltransferase complex dimerization subunit type 1 TsaB [Pirellulaceae bacterium]
LRLEPRMRTARGLAPAIRQLLEQVGWRPADLQLIAVTRGPGSFTGLRVGVTTAKTMAYALKIDVIGVDTLAVIASQAATEAPTGLTTIVAENAPTVAATPARLSVVLDAQRDQLFVADFALDARGQWQATSGSRIVDNSEWLARLAGDAPPAVSGPGLEKLLSRLPAGCRVVDRELWTPWAASVARVALRDAVAGRRDDLWALAPDYYRPSAAEEKFLSRE